MRRRTVCLFGGMLLVAVGMLAFLLGAPEAGGTDLPAGVQADRIVVQKSLRELALWQDGQPIKRYTVALGTGEPGPKRREGDNRTPEGEYRIVGRNPRSAYHLSLRISYPDAQDVASAAALGEPPGGDIMIHGIRNGLGWIGTWHRGFDWTAGCIAVTNAEIEELWRAVPDGTPIEILP